MQPGGATLVHLGFLGILTSIPIGDGTSGVYEDGNLADVATGLTSIGYFLSSSTVTVSEDTQDPALADPEVGHFLVRPTPVPALPRGSRVALGVALLLAGYGALARRGNATRRSRPRAAKIA